MRALLAALNAAKQTGDRISLTVAGVPGGVIVGADDFKHGTIAVVTRQIFGSEPAPGSAGSRSRPSAFSSDTRGVAER